MFLLKVRGDTKIAISKIYFLKNDGFKVCVVTVKSICDKIVLEQKQDIKLYLHCNYECLKSAHKRLEGNMPIWVIMER